MSHSHTRASVTLGLVLLVFAASVVTLLASGAVRGEPAASSDAVARPAVEGQCVVTGSKVAPVTGIVGAPLPIALDFKATCDVITTPLHVVFVLDASAAMSGEGPTPQPTQRALSSPLTPSSDMKVGAQNLVKALNLPANLRTRVAIVEFTDRARRLTELTNDQKAAMDAIAKIQAKGKTNIAAGLEEGARILSSARQPGQALKATEAIVLMTSGDTADSCAAAGAAATRVRADGITIISVCAMNGCPHTCVRDLASSRRFFFYLDVENMTDLTAAVLQMYTRSGVTIADYVLTDRLSPRVTLVRDSIAPPPSKIGPLGDELVWRGQQPPSGQVTVTYEVRPQQEGEYATSVEARIAYTSSIGVPGLFMFPAPVVAVFAGPSPTPDLPPPSATPTVGAPTAAPTKPTPDPTITAQPPRFRAFLPLGLASVDIRAAR